jgi:hypothetical protein
MSGPLAAFADTSLRHIPQFNAKSLFDGTTDELLLRSVHANGANASFDGRPFRRQAARVKFRRGQPWGRARTSGELATWGEP